MSVECQVPSIEELGKLLRAGDLTSLEMTRHLIDRADDIDPKVGVYATRLDEAALTAADRADLELAAGFDRGPLHGVPIGVKDILATSDAPTHANSRALDTSWGHGKDAAVVERLRHGGAVIVGKTTTMEFALGMPDNSSYSPLPRNPWDIDRWAGGSSSGSAAGVSSRLILGAIGTDTGGSIRVPAAFTGVTGLKPTYGLVPTQGCVPLAESLDHIGPIARSARDCALMLQVIANRPWSAAATTDNAQDHWAANLEPPDIRGLRIGVDRHHEPLGDGEAAAGTSFDGAIQVLHALGGEIVEIHLPYFDNVVAATVLTLAAEATSYHLDALRSRWADYGPMTRIALARGPLISSTDYLAAHQTRQTAQHALRTLFERVDVVISPAAVCTPPTVDRLQTYMIDSFNRVFTAYWNGVGNPALVVPMGFDDHAMPIGLQIAGAPFDELTVLSVGGAYQTSTDWHKQCPPPPGNSHIDPVPQQPPQHTASAPIVAQLLQRAGLRLPEHDVERLGLHFDRLHKLTKLLIDDNRSDEDAPASGTFAGQ